MGQEMGDGRGHVPAMTPGQDISGGDAVPFSPGRPDGFDGYGGVHQRPVHVEEDRLEVGQSWISACHCYLRPARLTGGTRLR